MSRTKLNPLRIVVVLAALATVTSGCSMLPKSDQGASSSSQPGDFSDDDDYSGRLLRQGQASSSPSQPNNGVQQASLDRSLPAEVSNQAIVASVVDVTAEEDEGFDWEDLDPANVARATRDALGYGPDEGIARDLLEEGKSLYVAKEYKAAGKKFLAAAKRWPESSLEEDALFSAGESFFYGDEYPDAHKAYQKLLKGHDYTHHLDRVTKQLFLMAQYWEKCAEKDPAFKAPVNLTDNTRPWVDTEGYALKAYDDIRMYDPTGPLADDSVMATAELYFRGGRYEEAARNYDQIRTEYPKSEHQMRAHLRGIESWQSIYQGGFYDAGPLERAAEIADQALIQFGPELGEARPQVVEAKNKIVEQLAARELLVGQYYDKRDRFGSARFYYESIVEDYPQTVAGQQARQRLTEIQGEPDKPKRPLEGFTKMFGREQYR